MHLTATNSAHAPQPAGGYAQAMKIEGTTTLLFVSGQIPETTDGQIPETFTEQAAVVWRNVLAQLAAAGMSVNHLVKVTTSLFSRDYAVENREARQKALGNHTPALTVIIAGIFDERWLLEIEAVAAA
jgi:enamine deaminase RidA (YjgF/YER057c/UK114 family)